jgi:hypothetical protein
VGVVVFTVMRLVVGMTAGVIVGMGSGAITGVAAGVTVGAGLGMIVRVPCAGTVARLPRDPPRRGPPPLDPVTRSVGPPHRPGVDDAAPSTTMPRDRIGRGT